MFTVSPIQMESFAAVLRDRHADELVATFQALPDAPFGALAPADLRERIGIGLRLASRHAIATRRDIALLCLAVARHGPAVETDARFAWVRELLAEAPIGRDNRVFRVDRRLRALP